jgi:alkenylglycerophosphocholine/alkenylglycerophosphoethanolamine hydrolase
MITAASIPIALSIAAALSAAAAIAADWEERRRRAFFVLKPLTTLLVIGIAASAGPLGSLYTQCVLVALALSLCGDIFLMLEARSRDGDGARSSDRAFIAGLVSFLLAHLAFVGAFVQDLRDPALPGWLAAVVFYAAGLLFVLLPRAGAMKAPVLVYCVVLALMVFAAAARHESLEDAASLRAVLGALLFLVSDSLLALRRFVRRYPGAQALILSTYWGAIGLIAWSV